MDELIIRPERPEDITGIDAVNRAAFAPRNAEADLVRRLRTADKVILSLVAAEEAGIVGHVLFSPAYIQDAAGNELPVVALGPIAVLPERQRKGFGSLLIRSGLEQLVEDGHEICILLGHPDYYPRFGFEPASRYGIRCQWEVPDPAFMVLALQTAALDGVSGTAYYAPEFEGV